VYNGAAYTYQLAPGVFQVQDETGVANYFYTIEAGNESIYHYQVHIRNGEIYSGEYFFNNRLYSVTYIYR